MKACCEKRLRIGCVTVNDCSVYNYISKFVDFSKFTLIGAWLL